jgi:hypothetical protein
MGRELKRVPLDFDWPINKAWEGYINPYNIPECHYCNGTGYNKETEKLYHDWYDKGWFLELTQDEVQALIDHNRLWDFIRVPINEDQKKDQLPNGWLPYNNGYIPTAEEVNKRAKQSILYHDSLNHTYCVEARAKRLGVFGYCEHCNGYGELGTEEEFKQREEWKYTEPPKGEGYQLWKTTLIGAPSSPVFDSLDKLCEWCEDNETTFADYKATKEEWKQMLSDNFVYHEQKLNNNSMIFM